MDTKLTWEEEQLIRGIKGYVTKIARDSFEAEKKEFREEVAKSIQYIVEETNKLNKIAHQLDKYITVGGELKDGKTVK